MDLPFVPIARRDLKLVYSAGSIDVVLALSAPYSPAKTPTALGSGPYACMVLNCDDPSLALEICGEDEFEALEMSLLHLEKFVDKLAAEQKAGKLMNADGTPFTPKKNVGLLAYYLGKQPSAA